MNQEDIQRTIESPKRGWTVGALIEVLASLSASTPVMIFCPFDSMGPESWEQMQILVTDKDVRLTP